MRGFLGRGAKQSAPLILSQFAILVLLAPSAAFAVVVAEGDDVSFGNPQVSDDGSVLVFEQRVMRTPGGANPPSIGRLPDSNPSFDLITDVMLLELDGSDAVHAITSDGESHEPSITGDGNRVGYWTRSGSLHRASVRFWIEDLQTGDRLEVWRDNHAEKLSGFDLSRNGRYLTYLRWIRGGSGELVLVDTVTGRGGVQDSGELRLAAQRPVSDEGVVYYSKRQGRNLQVFSVGLDSTPEMRTSSPDAEHLPPSVGQRGWVYVKRRETLRGILAQLWLGRPGSTSQELILTVTDPNEEIHEAVLGRDDQTVVFTTNTDLGTNNGDGSLEVFRLDLSGASPLQQVTLPEVLDCKAPTLLASSQHRSATLSIGRPNPRSPRDDALRTLLEGLTTSTQGAVVAHAASPCSATSEAVPGQQVRRFRIEYNVTKANQGGSDGGQQEGPIPPGRWRR